MSMSQTSAPRLPGGGWIAEKPDRRDRALFRTVPDIGALPDRVDNSALLPQPFDQKAIGSCVGWSAATTAYHTMRKDGRARPFMPSPVFLYREARVIGGYVEEDAGAEIRNAYKAMNRIGLPPMSNIKPRYRDEDMPDPVSWLFPENSIWRRKPAPSHYADAERRQVISYHKLFGLADLLQCLADGYCATIGFTVFRNFYTRDGQCHIDVPDPNPATDRELGGHAVTAYGYDKQRQRVMHRNSWGETAHLGTPNFTLSFAFMERYSDDWWSPRMVEGAKAA